MQSECQHCVYHVNYPSNRVPYVTDYLKPTVPLRLYTLSVLVKAR